MTEGSPEVQVRLFGPVQVTVGGTPVALNGTRLRTLVAVLAVSAGESVSIETLADRVWGENLPEQIRQSLHAMVFRLRRAIGADVLETVGTSYRLTVPAADIDVRRFENGLRDAKDADAITAALSAWTERPFVGTDSDWLTGTVLPGLEELRLGAIERSADLLGRQPSTELIAELRRLTADHPLRESLWIRLLRALVHTGRSAEALGLYDVIRSRLADELGIGPGPELQSLHTELLATDTALHPPAAAPPTADLAAPESLPARTPDFLGREYELEILTNSGHPLIAAIDGMPGVGKTTLALQAAHRLAARYPDGQMFIDLHGHSEGMPPVAAVDALGRLLLAFGVSHNRIPQELEDRAGLLRTLLARRRVLIVLDNAATETQIGPLLPGTPHSGVIVTSRLRLTGLDATATVSLETLEQSAAVELFARIAGAERVAGSSPDVLAEIAEWCGRLPLALRISAARLRTHRSWRPEDLLDRLQNHERLAELASGPRSVAAAIDLSYRELDAGLRRCYRLLGVLPGPEFRVWSASTLLGLEASATRQVLERLLEAHLLDEPGPGRYRFHDLVKDHAMRAADESPADRRIAIARLVERHCQSASEVASQRAPEEDFATHGLRPTIRTPEAARDWLDNESPTALLVPALATDHPGCIVHLASSLYWCLRDLGQYDVKAELQRRALTVVRAAGNVTAEVDILNRLGEVLRQASDHQTALDTFEQARTVARTVGYRLGELRAIQGMANVHGLQEHLEMAAAELHSALGIAEEIVDEHAQLDLLNAIGWIHVRGGNNHTSLEYRERALAIARRIQPLAVGEILRIIGCIQERLGDPGRALSYYDRALAHAKAIGNQYNELSVLHGMGIIYLGLGELEQATRYIERTMAMACQLGSRNWRFEAHQAFGLIRLASGKPGEALAEHQYALDLAIALDQLVDQARAHNGLGDALANLGRDGEASRRWQHALSILEAVGLQTADDQGTSVPHLLAKIAGAEVSGGQPIPGPTRVPTK
ncbi:MAG TPA: BTAD domain-containing putative transcriptional regulator [Kribbella sp.]|nr:BTAD domain-containing putative transcriptional regulator [Kribbella sp.]